MSSLLIDFWKWLNITPEKYSVDGVPNFSRQPEFYYPRFSELISEAKEIIDTNVLSVSELNDLITILAIDNEAENILEYIQLHSSDNQLKIIINLGVYHIQKEARWQIAELVFRRKPKGYMRYLEILAEDTDVYVKKRATNCMKMLGV